VPTAGAVVVEVVVEVVVVVGDVVVSRSRPARPA
jgi:hypothetical protein